MFEDRVKETATTTGTGNFTLAGAATNFQSFNTAFGTDKRFYYWIVDDTNNDWEHGIGYLSASTTLVREHVLGSTNSDAAVNFSAGTKDVFCAGSKATNTASFIGQMTLTSGIKYQAGANMIRTNTTQATTTDQSIWIPFWNSSGFLVDRIGVPITTGAGSAPPTNNFEVGIYEADPDTGEPGNLLGSKATAQDPSSSDLVMCAITEIFLPPGWYYIGWWCDTNPTLRAQDASIVVLAPFGGADSTQPKQAVPYKNSQSSLADPGNADQANASGFKLYAFTIGHS